ncbi:MAG TPA: winged helix-turn-helix domain-containing protein [Bryobacteraceae bacterium]|jgi:DNA-binding response OmpR family regulator|nr:winged helix-turn-helix domain-containing protein [Bryobacteraceae bacterium]
MEVLLRRAALGSAVNRNLLQLGGVFASTCGVRRFGRDGARVPLAPKEFHLLRYLVEHPEIVLTREQLLHGV